MPSQLDTKAFDQLSDKLKALGSIDFGPLMEAWGAIIEQDNAQGVLAGLDGWGRPLAPLAPSTIAHRKSAMGSADPSAPPLAPARQNSRVISAFTSGWVKEGNDYTAFGAWENVFTSKSGVQFLPFHFQGAGRLPRRDLAHLRPQGVKAAREALVKFIAETLRAKP